MTLSAFAAAVDRRDRQTDGRTPDRYIDPAPILRGQRQSRVRIPTAVVMPLTFILSLPFLLHAGLTPRIPRTVYRSF